MKKDEYVSLVAVSDIHSGSKAAIAWPNYKMAGGDIHVNSHLQQSLYDCWGGICDKWKYPDILVHCGDAIEGRARKESGVPCWSTDFLDQIGSAEKLLKMWKAKKYYIIDGTGYHVDVEGRSAETVLGERLDAVEIGDGGMKSADEVFLKVVNGNFNRTFHFSHHISVGTGWYKSTPIAREMVFALLNESHKHKADIIVRGHAHTFLRLEFTRQNGVILPAWQIQTRYMKRKSALGMLPDFGAVRWLIYKDRVEFEKEFFRPIAVKPKLFVYEKVKGQQ